MSFDEPLEVKNWKRERVLGSGGFGTVTLWKQKNGEQMIGNSVLLFVGIYVTSIHIGSFN